MRTDILDFYEFYRTALGAATSNFISAHLTEAWGDGDGLSIAGFGYANPYLKLFPKAQRRLSLCPGAQGVVRWPSNGKNCATLVSEHHWPLPDASVDRLLIVHGLEEAPDAKKLMREAWRVLTDDGQLIIVASHRRGLWAMVETTPFAAGRPYLKGQLKSLMREALFRPDYWSSALFFPPIRSRFLLRAARAWERAGTRVWPGLSGVLMVQAAKDMAAPAGLTQRAPVRAIRPAIAAPQPLPRTTPSSPRDAGSLDAG